MTTQACPNCQKTHDVSVFVSGQKITCACGIRFEVRRTDVSGPARRVSGSDLTAPGRMRNRPPEPAVPGPAEPPAVDATFISSSPRPLLPGYELTEILGRGGMGEVWRARQLSLGREVAVKLLPSRLASDQEFVARFEKEATALAALSHPNIIQIIDRGMSGDQYYFVMEFVNGRSLRDAMGRNRVAWKDALKVVAQICRAIESAHDKQIIHRDLKPENILLDERGHVKVADFGLAGVGGSEEAAHLTATAVAMGTLNYMAPEQRLDAKHVDGRADIYSVGVILYELLTGELPIGRFKLPGERGVPCDPRLDEVVARALESEPEARYPNATSMLTAMEELIGDSSSTPGLGSSLRASALSGKETLPLPRRALRKGWHGARLVLLIVGGMVALAYLANRLPRHWAETQTAPAVPLRLPPNTEDQIYASVKVEHFAENRTHLLLPFDDGDEQLNCHMGAWRLRDGKLWVTQAGDAVSGNHLKIVPRAYLAHRYFSSNDFAAQAEVSVRALEPEYSVDGSAQRFAELAFRRKDLQVSLFAVPGAGMRLAWRYLLPDGNEVSGDSAQDVQKLLADEVVLPPDGTPFQLRLELHKRKGGVEVEAFAQGQVFVRKVLPGLEDQTAKVALGCRNLHCSFDALDIVGLERSRPHSTGEVATDRL